MKEAEHKLAFKGVREYVSLINRDSITYCTKIDDTRSGDIILGAVCTGDPSPGAIVITGGGLAEKVSIASKGMVDLWEKRLLQAPATRIQTHSLSYDNTLAFVLLLLRCRFHISIESHFSSWLDVARAAKSGNFYRIGKPGHSIYWLINSLGHGYLDDNGGCIAQNRVASGFLLIVDLLLTALEKSAAPTDVVPSIADTPSFGEAMAFHRFARERYEKVVASGDSLQMLLPVASGNRRMLVDVLLASDKKPLGDIRAFAIDDEFSTWRRAGYSVIATHQQLELGNKPYGYLISVLDTRLGISLEYMVPALQSLENRKSEDSGPAKWETDYDGSLLRTAKNGSQTILEWKDVLQVFWEICNPGVGLRICSWLGPGKTELSEPTEFTKILRHDISGKRFSAIRWSAVSNRDELPTCPTFYRLLVAYLLADCTLDPMLPSISCLPPLSSIRHLEIPGGFILIHFGGAVVVDDWTKDPVDFECYFTEFENVCIRYKEISTFGERLRLTDLLHSMLAKGASVTDDEFDSWLEGFARLKLELGEIHALTLSRPTGHHAKLFRAEVEESWGVGEQLQDLTSAVEQMHSGLEIIFKTRNERAIFMWQRAAKAIGATAFSGIALSQILGFMYIPGDVRQPFVVVISLIAGIIVWRTNRSRHRQSGVSGLDNVKQLLGE